MSLGTQHLTYSEENGLVGVVVHVLVFWVDVLIPQLLFKNFDPIVLISDAL